MRIKEVVYADSKIAIATVCPSQLELDVQRKDIDDSFTETYLTTTLATATVTLCSGSSEMMLDQLSSSVDNIEELQEDGEQQPLDFSSGSVQADEEMITTIVYDGNIFQTNADMCIEHLSSPSDTVIVVGNKLDKCVTADSIDVSENESSVALQIAEESSAAPIIETSSSSHASLEKQQSSGVDESREQKLERTPKKGREQVVVSPVAMSSRKKPTGMKRRRREQQKAIRCRVMVGIRSHLFRKSKSMSDVNNGNKWLTASAPPHSDPAPKKLHRVPRKGVAAAVVQDTAKKSSKRTGLLSFSADSSMSEGVTAGSHTDKDESWSPETEANDSHRSLATRQKLRSGYSTEAASKKRGTTDSCKSQSYHGPFLFSSSSEKPLPATTEGSVPSDEHAGMSTESSLDKMATAEEKMEDCGASQKAAAVMMVVHAAFDTLSVVTASSSSKSVILKRKTAPHAKFDDVDRRPSTDLKQDDESTMKDAEETIEETAYQRFGKVEDAANLEVTDASDVDGGLIHVADKHAELAKFHGKSRGSRKMKTKKLASKKRTKQLLTPDEKGPAPRLVVAHDVSPRKTPIAVIHDVSPRKTPVAAPRDVSPRKAPIAVPRDVSPRKTPRDVSPQKAPIAVPRDVSPRKTPMVASRDVSPRKTPKLVVMAVSHAHVASAMGSMVDQTSSEILAAAAAAAAVVVFKERAPAKLQAADAKVSERARTQPRYEIGYPAQAAEPGKAKAEPADHAVWEPSTPVKQPKHRSRSPRKRAKKSLPTSKPRKAPVSSLEEPSVRMDSDTTYGVEAPSVRMDSDTTYGVEEMSSNVVGEDGAKDSHQAPLPRKATVHAGSQRVMAIRSEITVMVADWSSDAAVTGSEQDSSQTKPKEQVAKSRRSARPLPKSQKVPVQASHVPVQEAVPKPKVPASHVPVQEPVPKSPKAPVPVPHVPVQEPVPKSPKAPTPVPVQESAPRKPQPSRKRSAILEEVPPTVETDEEFETGADESTDAGTRGHSLGQKGGACLSKKVGSCTKWRIEMGMDERRSFTDPEHKFSITATTATWTDDESKGTAPGGRGKTVNIDSRKDVADDYEGGVVSLEDGSVRRCSARVDAPVLSAAWHSPTETLDAKSETFVSVHADSVVKVFQDCISISSGAFGPSSEDEAFTAEQWSFEDPGPPEGRPNESERRDDALFDIDDVYSSEVRSEESPAQQFTAVAAGRAAVEPDSDNADCLYFCGSSSETPQSSYPALREPDKSDSDEDAAVELVVGIPKSNPSTLTECSALDVAQQQLLTSTWSQLVHRPKWDATADLFLRCGEETFPVHRLIVVHYSERLCHMLYEGVLPPERTMVVEGLAPSVLKEVVNWMYTGRIDFNRVNILEVLLVALGLDIQALQELCRGLIRHLSKKYRMQLPYFAFDQSLPCLADDVMAANFDSIVLDTSFNEYTVEEVCRLLSCDVVKAESEIEVYKAAVQWLTYEWPQRQGCISQVMGHVRCCFLDTSVLEDLINKNVASVAEQEILTSQEMKTILQNALLFKCYNLERRLSTCRRETLPSQRRFLCQESVRISFADVKSSMMSINASSIEKSLKNAEFALTSDQQDATISGGQSKRPKNPVQVREDFGRAEVIRGSAVWQSCLSTAKLSVAGRVESLARDGVEHSGLVTGARWKIGTTASSRERTPCQISSMIRTSAIIDATASSKAPSAVSAGSKAPSVVSASTMPSTEEDSKGQFQIGIVVETTDESAATNSSHVVKPAERKDQRWVPDGADRLRRGSSAVASTDSSKWASGPQMWKLRGRDSKLSSKEIVSISLNSTMEDDVQESELLEISLEKSLESGEGFKLGHPSKAFALRGKDSARTGWRTDDGSRFSGEEDADESLESDFDRRSAAEVRSSWSAQLQFDGSLHSDVSDVDTTHALKLEEEYSAQSDEEDYDDDDEEEEDEEEDDEDLSDSEAEDLLSSYESSPSSSQQETVLDVSMAAELRVDEVSGDGTVSASERQCLQFAKTMRGQQKHGAVYEQTDFEGVPSAHARKSGKNRDGDSSVERRSLHVALLPPMQVELSSRQRSRRPSRDTTLRVDSVSSLSSLGYDTGCVLLFGGTSQPHPTENDKIASLLHYYDADCEVWGGVNKLPEPRFDTAACRLGDGIYVAGGIDHRSINSDRRSMRSMWLLDLQKWTWRELSSMPRKRSGHSLVALDNLVYAIGGAADYSGNGLTAAVDAYNPRKDRWTSVASLPLPLWKMAAASHHGQLWVCGGCTKSTLELGGPAEHLVNDVYVYQPQRYAWFSGKRLPQGRAMASLVEVAGQVVLIGGLVGSIAAEKAVTGELTVFCHQTERWCHLTDMSVPRCSFSAVTAGDKITILGGRNAQFGSPLSKVEIYDFETDQWMGDLNVLPTPLSNCAAVRFANNCAQRLLGVYP